MMSSSSTLFPYNKQASFVKSTLILHGANDKAWHRIPLPFPFPFPAVQWSHMQVCKETHPKYLLSLMPGII